MFRYLPLVIKNSLRNRRRSLLTISSVAASMCLLGVLFALYKALFLPDPNPNQALRLITYHRVSLSQALPASYEAKIRQVPGVREISIWQWFGGVYKDARDQRNFFARFGVEPDRFLAIRTDYTLPEAEKQAFLHNRTGAIASRTLADKFGWQPGERITLVGDIFPVKLELTLVGIFDEPDRGEVLFFNHEYLREAMTGPRKDTVGSFSVLAENAEAANRIPQAIDQLFENAPEPTRTETESAFVLQFLAFLGNVKLFLIVICGAVSFTILLVSANTMAMSVRERMPEVGILKTLGYTNRAVLGIILGEACFISLLGGVLGVLLTGGLIAVVKAGGGGVQQVKAMAMTPALVLLCLTFAMLIGLVSSIVPAAGAARTGILDSLKDAG